MKRDKKIERCLNGIDKAWAKRIAAEAEEHRHENRLAKIVIGWLYRHNRKALTNLDRSAFGMFMHDASLDSETHTITASLWYSRRNEDGTESIWCEHHDVKLDDLRKG
ncbi:MAG: hypothetical protein J6X18_00605 [Bacteroidales bacterium]|nr:hypothetical protein [Bacteroidales bacterium]